MMKFQFVYLTLCSLTQAAYISRMANVNRIRGPVVPFRPGVTLSRPWTHPRLVQAASHRVPYVIYRNPPHRYAVKHYQTVPRKVFTSSPWKTTAKLPPITPVTPEYEFIRAASATPALHTDGGAIHTIPAPNLSLSEKPIVVIEASDGLINHKSPDQSKPVYEVTEKPVDPPMYQMSPKIEFPVGFSKATSLTQPEIQGLVRNGVALQFASDYGLPAVALPQSPIPQSAIGLPHQFTIQGFNSIPSQQDLTNNGAEGIVIPPQVLYQPDPMFLQKLQSQLMQRFPSVEFIPYAADLPQSPIPLQVQTETPSPLYLLEQEEITKQTPTSFEPSKHIVQRETQEGSIVTLVPQALVVSNVTENQIEVISATEPQNVSFEMVAAESQPGTTTIKYVIETKEPQAVQNTTPIYYAQIGQSVGESVAKGFYSAINDVRAAAALVQVEKPQEQTTQVENVTTTTINPDLKAYFVQKSENQNNHSEVKPLLGIPFTKTADSVNIAYTLLRTSDKEPKVTQEGAVYAGQLVEATISEDHDFNKQKNSLISKRAPLRLFAVEENKNTTPAANTPQKFTVVKAKIPPKSKLTFDDKTGEPVLRIYASYMNNPLQKEIIASKLANIKNVNEIISRKQDSVNDWKAATVKAIDKTQEPNYVTNFGLKLRSRSDDYIPLFEEYEE
ncbi:uncharacterized protein LOC113515653 isoform X2 [Galleria mellonella]|uniref:Uncharacterized protein LOC113515653 isoform X2 n=1 Tax=Galleria mellonella TaxID=7137 RepID=A0A6J3CAR4_GALME|nr:uncharacterized protein LOC113515653 isoform X2 [Galleria mellonella]